MRLAARRGRRSAAAHGAAGLCQRLPPARHGLPLSPPAPTRRPASPASASTTPCGSTARSDSTGGTSTRSRRSPSRGIEASYGARSTTRTATSSPAWRKRCWSGRRAERALRWPDDAAPPSAVRAVLARGRVPPVPARLRRGRPARHGNAVGDRLRRRPLPRAPSHRVALHVPRHGFRRRRADRRCPGGPRADRADPPALRPGERLPRAGRRGIGPPSTSSAP